MREHGERWGESEPPCGCTHERAAKARKRYQELQQAYYQAWRSNPTSSRARRLARALRAAGQTWARARVSAMRKRRYRVRVQHMKTR
jgi:hypothetical protein